MTEGEKAEAGLDVSSEFHLSSEFLYLELLLCLIKELISPRYFIIITIVLYYLKLIMVLVGCYTIKPKLRTKESNKKK